MTDVLLWYLAAAILILAAFFITTKVTENAWRGTLYAWAGKHPQHELLGVPAHYAPANLLLKGAHAQASRLSHQGLFLHLEEAPKALEWYLKSVENGSDLSESKQSLKQLLEGAYILAVSRKKNGLTHSYERIMAWRREVSVWEEIVARMVPKLKQEISGRAATA